MSNVLKYLLILLIVLLIVNDLGAIAMTYWRGSDICSEISKDALATYKKTKSTGAAKYKVRQLCKENGYIFESFKIEGSLVTVRAKAPAKGTIWMHRIKFLQPYLSISVEGSNR